jgi:hypothetical protein
MSNLALFPATANPADVERPDGVRTVWLKVTPHWAMKALQEYDDFCAKHPDLKMNRNVTQNRVAKMASDMRQGMWARNHQGIAFDTNGILIDGQHRLWAVVESAATVMMQVTHGLDRREAQPTIDIGGMRTLVDTCAIAGFTGIRALHAGVLKAMLRGMNPVPPQMSRVEELQAMQRHKTAIEFTLSLFPVTRVRGIMRAPVLAVIARASYTQDREKLRRFAEVLQTGQRENDTEAVIVMLNQYLLLNHKEGGQGAMEAYKKTTRALQAFLRGEKLRTLYAAREDVFRFNEAPGKRGA